MKENNKTKKNKEQTTENKSIEVVKEKENKFIEIIKKRWLINSSKTFLLVALILAFFIVVSIVMQKLELTPIDLTEDKLFTLTEGSKEQVRNIEQDVNLYFIGYTDESSTLDLARQYTKANEKIKVEVVTAESRPDLVQKYGIEEGSQGIIVETGERYKVLASSDLYTYNYATYENIDITEEKLTSSIKSVTIDKLPKIYFLEGYSSYSLNRGMQYLSMYLANEVNEIETLDILSQGKVPEDCNTLVITTPEKDFDDIATNAIIDYINKGGNILWLNAAIAKNISLTNVNKILEVYGVQPFTIGTIRETDDSKMVTGTPDLIMPLIQYSDVTSKLADAEGVIFVNATKINVEDDETLENLKVAKIDLIRTSDSAYFRTNFALSTTDIQDGEEQGEFLVGAQFIKTLQEENEEDGTKKLESTLIIYGENYFVSDYPITQNTPTIVYRQNKDLVLNSIAFLADREEDITVRKSTGTVTYTATEQEHKIILAIITAVPLSIIAIGILVWIKRRRKK